MNHFRAIATRATIQVKRSIGGLQSRRGCAAAASMVDMFVCPISKVRHVSSCHLTVKATNLTAEPVEANSLWGSAINARHNFPGH
jgi:hypothetical protein